MADPGEGEPQGEEEEVVVAAEEVAAPTLAWAAETVTGSAPTHLVATTTSRGACSATDALHPGMDLEVHPMVEDHPGVCVEACGEGPGEEVEEETEGAVGEVPWEAVGAAWEEDPWEEGEVFQGDEEDLAVEDQCGADLGETEETGEPGPTRAGIHLGLFLHFSQRHFLLFDRHVSHSVHQYMKDEKNELYTHFNSILFRLVVSLYISILCMQ